MFAAPRGEVGGHGRRRLHPWFWTRHRRGAQDQRVQKRWLEAADNPRAGSAPRKLIEALPSHPVLTFRTAQEITGLGREACRQALNRLEKAGVLGETTAGKRNRVWESVGLFDLLVQIEREAGDPRRTPAPTH